MIHAKDDGYTLLHFASRVGNMLLIRRLQRGPKDRHSLMHQRLLWFYLRIRPILELVIDWIGKHPLIIIVFPSIWLFIRYKPFWKDVDVVAQLIVAPGSL